MTTSEVGPHYGKGTILDHMRRHVFKHGSFKAAVKKSPCSYCGTLKKKGRGRDHIQPRSKGGPDGWTNRASACGQCDKTKSSQLLLYFLVTHAPFRTLA
jgi:5-methylcytosine-specific restriction endonuclease McrA